jgi:glycosyltransferase involved in cell wall biosynthesis
MHRQAMKVGLIVPGFSSDADDWCIPVLVDVVRELSRRAEVHVFALRYPDRQDGYGLHGAQVHTLGGGETRGAARTRLLAAACARVMAEHRRGPFFVLHGLWADEPAFVSVTTARLLRIPAFASVMGGELVGMPDIGYGGRLVASNRLLTTVALRGADRVTAGSSPLVELVRHSMPAARSSRVVRLPWGIDPQLFATHGPTLKLAGESRVLHVGSLVPIKDHATLLRSIARLKRIVPGVHLHLVGDGPLRSNLRAEAEALGLGSAVTFHGHVARHELASYYRSADVVAVSSRHEAQLVVALEAALCGTPVVGTAVGLVSDFASPAAPAAPVGDDKALAGSIQAALQPEIGRALGEAACRLVRSDYLAAQTADKLIAMYRNHSTTYRAA